MASWPKFQLLSLLLGVLGAVFLGCALFAMNENSSGASSWERCDINCNTGNCKGDYRITLGLLNMKAHDNTGYYFDETVSNCDDRAQTLFGSFSPSPQKVCDQGKLTLGLGICALIFIGFALIVSLLAIFKDFSWKWMLPALSLYLVSALFSAIGGALYREKMTDIMPNLSTSAGQIKCSVQTGPMALVFIGFIMTVFAALFFTPIKWLLPNDNGTVARNASPAATSPRSPTGAVAFTTMSSDFE